MNLYDGILLKPEGPIYMIQHKVRRNPSMFLFSRIELPSDVDTIMWTPKMFNAQEFYTEESVETFKYKFLRGRPVQIILVDSSCM